MCIRDSCKVPCTWLFVMAGQVDVDFVWYYRRMFRPELSFQDQIEASAANLIGFLEELVAEPEVQLSRSRVVLHGVHPPPLGDDLHIEAIKHHMIKSAMDQDVVDGIGDCHIPDHQERTAMAFAFNEALRGYVADAGFVFVDVSKELVDPVTGVVRECFKREDSFTDLEIHLDSDQLVPLYLEKYKALGFMNEWREEVNGQN
eukprot:TRINITY_DN43696_c0_g1_i1.p1 TRINITY_DN43696_c0_g1~~TRINITY_DN43696_c0_g1_i1.p1  ORF type:complete len:202 (-),score=54.52 TRINITY_DN43696_c0_g1_i1:111-716(-)